MRSLVEDAIFEGGLLPAEAGKLTPLELVLVIGGARYRALRAADDMMYAAYAIVRAHLGRRTPRFKRLLGRNTAQEFKDLSLARTDEDRAAVRQLVAKVAEKVAREDRLAKARALAEQRSASNDSPRRTKGHPRR